MARFKNSFLVKRRPSPPRPQAELITIGTELLTGSVVNTNAAYLARELTQLGFRVTHQSACHDEFPAIQEALRGALSRSDVIFMSGGLGPTPDDLTRQAIADYFHAPLVFSRRQYRQICRFYKRKGKQVPSLVREEACFPANARPLFNRFGIAVGFTLETEGRWIAVLPGVPGELTRMVESKLKGMLKRRYPGLGSPHLLIVKIVGLSEPEIMERLDGSFFRLGQFQFGIYPEVNEVTLRIYADSSEVIHRLKQKASRVMRREIYSFSEETLESCIGKKLLRRRRTLAVAESCTGGQISERITRISGASRYFRGDVTAYQNSSKVRFLGVPRALLKSKGAVSREVALAMARGARTRFDTTLGVAVTGIAGPSGGGPGKPVGLVYIAIDSGAKRRVWKEWFGGDRAQIQDRAAKKTLEYLWRWVSC